MRNGRRSISTGISKVFKKRPDGLWQEYINTFIHTSDSDGNQVSKLDKSIIGRVYKEALDGEQSFHGEALWTNPDTGVTIRLVALSNYQQG